MIWDLVLVIFGLAGAAILASSVINGAPYVPTRAFIVEKMLEGVGPGMKLVDLGSGDGRIVMAAARKGAEAVGFEINPILVLISRWRIRRRKLSAKVYWKSFWQADLSPFDVVTVFGITKIMPGLEAKFRKELKRGACIVSYAFALPTWPQTEKHDSLYFYRKENLV